MGTFPKPTLRNGARPVNMTLPVAEKLGFANMVVLCMNYRRSPFAACLSPFQTPLWELRLLFN